MPSEPRSEETDDRVERTASGSFPVIDRRSAGLTRSFPPNAPSEQPATPSRLTRAFPGGDDPVAPETTPLTGAFPGGGDRVPAVEPPTGADRPIDLPGRRAAMGAPPAAAGRAGEPAQDESPSRPPLRLDRRDDDPASAGGDEPRGGRARSGQSAGREVTPGFAAEPGPNGYGPSNVDPATGGFAPEATGFAAEGAGGGFGSEPPSRPPGEPRSVVDDMLDELSGLPQRVPAEPDVPTVPEPPSDTPADPPQLARIATHLRRPDSPVVEQERPDGFDVDAILAAVRGVAGVKDARLRTTPAGAHSLRLDLSDGADAADVSRHVARLLQERMGLAAAPQNLPGMMPAESPLGGDTPPTGFTRNGGYVPPPPAPPARRPSDAAAARSASRPADATTVRSASRPTDQTSARSTAPADARSAARPADATTARSAPHPADADTARSAPSPTDARSASQATDPASGRPAQPPGFEPSTDPSQRPAGSPRGRAQVGGQSGVDTRDLADRAAAAASAPVYGAPQQTDLGSADDPERGHVYGGQREASRSRRVASDPPGQPVPGSFPDLGSAAGIIGSIGGHPVLAGATAYSGGQISTTESAPSRPLNPGANPGPRVVIDHVQVSTFGLDATVETRLAAGKRLANGLATGPAVDGYVLRLCAVSAAAAIDELLRTAPRDDDRGRCFVEHAAVVPFGNCEVAVVVVLLVCGGWVEQLAGSALVSGDPRQAVVRATLAAVNRRLEALLSD
ncbi:hypothetical protein [Asanoa ferruginea]|uniref:hypothetical protein n=1 Tax=Asanoa ferruginea TaxID=53367 RepID=UPI001EF1642B|nr:hypothetical protein [Asanoa ferruginea]